MRPNVAELLRERAAERPDAVALVEDGDAGRTVTWGDLDGLVDAVARGLSARGMVAGRRVALALPGSVPFVATYLAAQRAGLVPVPLDPRAPAAALLAAVRDSGASLVLVGGEAVGTARTGLPGVPLVVDGAATDGETSWDDLAATPGTESPPGPRDPERTALLAYSSGTGDRPRGVMLSHRALLANVEQVAAVDPPLVRPDDVVLGVLPMFHAYGLGAVLGQVLATGARLVLVDRADPDAQLRAMAEHRVTHVPLAPSLVAAWLERPGLREAFASVRTVLSGARPLDPALATALRDATGAVVEQGYGLAEAGPVVAVTAASPGRDRAEPPPPASVGHPLAGVEVRLVDAEGREAHHGDPGEILVRGAHLFSGYWPDGAGGPDPSGWWATGDVGIAGDDGGLVLVDRAREQVVVGGFTVFPREVEETLLPLAEVAEVAVIGADGTPDGGEGLVAFVVPAPGTGAEAVRSAVQEHARATLPRYRRPREVHVVDALPHAASGAVAKGRLRARLRSAGVEDR